MTEGEERKEKGRNENHKNYGMMKPDLRSSDNKWVHKNIFDIMRIQFGCRKKCFRKIAQLSTLVAIIHHELNTSLYYSTIMRFQQKFYKKYQ